ncbi:MAG: glycosyltransferase family 4 protein [Geopsychrobacter sp.]|nr:glycosyltransferase family 4 protein [Geopsychrobacter sp.]
MRILIWSQYFWPENFRINELVASLVEEGMHVTVLTGKPNYPGGRIFPGYKVLSITRERFAGADVVRLPLVPRGSGSAFGLAINYLSFILTGYILSPVALRGQHYDGVVGFAPAPLLQVLPAIFLARLKHASVVVWVQDLWPESLIATGFIKNPLVIKSLEAIIRYIYRHADTIMIQSRAFREPVARLTNDVRKILYYPNTAEPTLNTATNEGGCLTAREIRQGFSVVFTGNIGKAQSMETILQAAEDLATQSDIRFYIVGGGSQAEWLKQEIRCRHLNNVLMTGHLPLTAMPEIFAAASALLVTLGDSPVLAAVIPSKLQAYLAAGKPVIASLNGEGARIVLEAGAGFSCPAENGTALADKVRRLYALSPEERLRLGKNGREYFDAHFDPKKQVHKLIDHFIHITEK